MRQTQPTGAAQQPIHRRVPADCPGPTSAASRPPATRAVRRRSRRAPGPHPSRGPAPLARPGQAAATAAEHAERRTPDAPARRRRAAPPRQPPRRVRRASAAAARTAATRFARAAAGHERRPRRAQDAAAASRPGTAPRRTGGDGYDAGASAGTGAPASAGTCQPERGREHRSARHAGPFADELMLSAAPTAPARYTGMSGLTAKGSRSQGHCATRSDRPDRESH